MKMIKKYFKLKRKDIVLIQFIIEGYEGMATVTTMDPHMAVIQIAIIPDYVSEMNHIIKSLENNYEIEEMSNFKNSNE